MWSSGLRCKRNRLSEITVTAKKGQNALSKTVKPRPIAHWPSGAHALATLGTQTAKIVSDLLGREDEFNLFSKLELEDELKLLAQALSTFWTDGQAASIVRGYAEQTNAAKGVDINALCRWIRLHPNDSEAVFDCMTVLPPEDITVIRRCPKVGSQKIVYRARWRLTLRDIVLKRLTGTLEHQKEILERESQTHPFSMGHPNIIETHCLTNAHGEKFLAEELLPVVLNDDWLSEGTQEAANLIYDISKALTYIHEELGLVHGDVKPDNIGSKDGSYILLDFGICRPVSQFICDATATGSLRTRAPELFETDAYPDPPKADVWALGATAYKAITGRFPFIKSGEPVPRITQPDRRRQFEKSILHRIRSEWGRYVDLDLVPQPAIPGLGFFLGKVAGFRNCH